MADDPGSLALSRPADLARTRQAVDTLAYQSAVERKDYMDTQLAPFLDARVTPEDGHVMTVNVDAKTCTWSNHLGQEVTAHIPLPKKLIKPNKMRGKRAMFLKRWSDETYWFDMMME